MNIDLIHNIEGNALAHRLSDALFNSTNGRLKTVVLPDTRTTYKIVAVSEKRILKSLLKYGEVFSEGYLYRDRSD